ncbi:MAG: hypothetical protein U0230_17140 [Polyangiales bacterium]
MNLPTPTYDSSSSQPSLPLVALLREAFSTFGRRLGLHVGVTLNFFGWFVLVCCLNACLAVPIVGMGVDAAGGLDGQDPRAALETMMRPMVVAYAIGLVLLSIAGSIHHGTTLVVIRATRNGEDIRFVDALRGAMSRGFAHAGSSLLRYGIDWLVGIPIILLQLRTLFPDGLVVDPSIRPHISAQQHVISWIGYVLWLVWIVSTRAFDGLSNAAVQFEGLGPVDSLRRSSEILRGRRLRVFGIRLGWSLAAFVFFVLAYTVPLSFVSPSSPRDGTGFGIFLFVVYLPIMYLLGMLLVGVDSALEVAIYDRLVPSKPKGESVAEVFA